MKTVILVLYSNLVVYFDLGVVFSNFDLVAYLYFGNHSHSKVSMQVNFVLQKTCDAYKCGCFRFSFNMSFTFFISYDRKLRL